MRTRHAVKDFHPTTFVSTCRIMPLVKVPQQWLAENRLCICPSCNKLVAISWFSHHKQSCVTSVSHGVASSSTQSQSSFNLPSIQQATYPSIEEVLSCRCPTLKYIPKRARQHFGSVLTEVLKQVIFENPVEAWTRLHMLLKCVLPSSRRKGKGKHMIPIESLCQDWKDGKELLLWAKAVSRVSVKDYLRSDPDTDKKKLASGIACAEEGLFSKACRILTSHGIAPNNDTMFKLLKSKHPYAIAPTIPSVPTSIPAIQLPLTFNIAATLRTFLKEQHVVHQALESSIYLMHWTQDYQSQWRAYCIRWLIFCSLAMPLPPSHPILLAEI